MSISAFTGPLITFGEAPYADSNPEMGTSLSTAGFGILDPRTPFTYQPGQRFGSPTCGWVGQNPILTLYGAPQTLSKTLFTGAGGHITSGTALPLITATVAGCSVGNTITRSDTNAQVTGLLQIDPLATSSTCALTSGSNVLTVSAMASTGADNPIGLTIGSVLVDASTAANIPTGAYITGFGTGNGGIGTYTMSAAATATAASDTVTSLFNGSSVGTTPLTIPLGSAGTIQLYHPGAMFSRAVQITSTTSQVSGVVFTVNGFDVYGYPITETITTSGTSATSTLGKKAFKYIQSITPVTPSGNPDNTGFYSAGTQDIIGFPIRSDQWLVSLPLDVTIFYSAALIAASTGYLAGVELAATATTGDVRGTYALQSASDGTKKVYTLQAPYPQSLQSATGLFGVSQFASF